jgi:DNA-binding NtrC family response regulator
VSLVRERAGQATVLVALEPHFSSSLAADVLLAGASNLLSRPLQRRVIRALIERHLSDSAPSVDATLAQVSRWHIRRVLDATGQHVVRAASRLGVCPSTLYKAIKDFGLDEQPAFRLGHRGRLAKRRAPTAAM